MSRRAPLDKMPAHVRDMTAEVSDVEATPAAVAEFTKPVPGW